ncbi:MAG: DUF1549 domain-containing protein [Fuerstiella sp.]
MKLTSLMTCGAVVGLLAIVVIKAGSVERISGLPKPIANQQQRELQVSVSRVNQWLRDHWAENGVEPADLADDLTVYRRLSLALFGRIPSLEEVNAFRSDRRSDRLERWLSRMLEDRAYGDYFGNRIVRMLTGIEEGLVFVFRRDRMSQWMSDSLMEDRPWSEITEDCIAADGLWTSRPAANFLTAAWVDGEGFDLNALAGRTVRSFLGQRIDCAQCHDHFFAEWTQGDFEGLAAFYGQTQLTFSGVVDRPTSKGFDAEYRIVEVGMIDELEALEEGMEPVGRIVNPQVPFHEEWMSTEGSRRQQLASWVTHSSNRRFERAIANRTWGLMFGRAWFDPVDDLPDPPEDDEPQDLLDVLGAEYRRHDESLKSLIQIIALSDAFRLKSDVVGVDEEMYAQMDSAWARFPLVRLRPEQMIGAMFQAGRVKTIDQQSNVFQRFARFFNENDFLKEYGDETEDELIQQSATIPQALLRMNGSFTRELTKAGLFSAVGQLVDFSADDTTLVQNCFLACLTRLPDAEEREWFVSQLRERRDQVKNDTISEEEKGTGSRNEIASDLFWVLFNSPGFSWNR